MSPLGIVIPSSGTSNRVGSGFNLAQSVAGSVHGEAQPGLILEEDSGFLPDIDFNFDADGNIVELDPVQQPTLPQSGPPGRVRSDSAVSARVRQEHQEGQQQIVCLIVI